MNAWPRSPKPRPRLHAQHQELPTQRQSLFQTHLIPFPNCMPPAGEQSRPPWKPCGWLIHTIPSLRTRPRTPPSATRARSSPSRALSLNHFPRPNLTILLSSSSHLPNTQCQGGTLTARDESIRLAKPTTITSSLSSRSWVCSARRASIRIANRKFSQQRYAYIPDSSRRSARSRRYYKILLKVLTFS